MISDFLEFLMNGVFDLLEGLFGLLPQMPITADDLSQFLNLELVATVYGWMNYFLPLDIAAGIVALWSTAMLAYVGIKLAIRYTGKVAG